MPISSSIRQRYTAPNVTMSSTPAVSIGNYKGVMLCNRPFVGMVGTSKGVAASAKQAFVCGNVGDKPGTNVPISSKEKAATTDQHPRKETALQRHRKWLAELQATKEQLEKHYLADVQMKEDRHKRFMEREARMRAMVRKAKGSVLDFESQAKDEHGEETSVEKASFEDSTRETYPTVADGKSPAPPSRPMWALTEQQALSSVDCAEKNEADDLLDFANGLDFDKYISDSEVSALIENVRSRITELEASQLPTPKPAQSLATRPTMNLTAEHLPCMSEQGDEDTSVVGDECASVARSVLEADDTGKIMGAVHSHKSLTAIAQRSKAALAETLSTVSEEIIAPPLVMKHTDDAGARLEGKNSVSNLPYMHRNPAV